MKKEKTSLSIEILDGEFWWGGTSAHAEKQPFTKESIYSFDMTNGCNQTMPLFVSNMGRYVWCESPMTVHIENGIIELSSKTEITLYKAGNTLKEAYLEASKKHFPFSGKVPPLEFFTTAQYNTWMELDYNQTQEGVLRYAHGLIDEGYEPGILMIDEGWHTRYGLWEFDKAKFPDPKAMIDELHTLGFIVMLWVVPMVTADGKDFVIASEPTRKNLVGGGGENDYFLRTDNGEIALVHWWNGYSAMLNMCKQCDRDFLDSKLQVLMREYGVDGFKFDGGNISCYNQSNIINGTQTKYTPEELNIAWNEFGARYKYHEYKDTFKGGGKAVIQRLQDRNHSWDNYGLTSILPSALLQGLIGHPFICPDMVGGGEWSFNYQPNFKCDQELFVRMAQCSALFPMIQYSWAPWRMLSKKYSRLALASFLLHKSFSEYITELVNESAVTGEPIIRHMEYEYPHKGYATISDQFLLGKNVLVSPVLKKGETKRMVILPEGTWLYQGKTEISGNRKIMVEAPIDTLPFFIKK